MVTAMFSRISGLDHDDALREERIDRLRRELCGEPCRDRRVALDRAMKAEMRARTPRAVKALASTQGLR